MNSKTPNVAALSTDQVRSILALGMALPQADAAPVGPALAPNARRELTRRDLGLVMQDLATPVLSPETGPLSFRRLTGITEDFAKQFTGKTFLEALRSRRTADEALACLAKYGRLLSTVDFPETTRRTGSFFRVLALAALAIRQKQSTVEPDLHGIKAALEALLASPDVPAALQDHLARTNEQL